MPKVRQLAPMGSHCRRRTAIWYRGTVAVGAWHRMKRHTGGTPGVAATRRARTHTARIGRCSSSCDEHELAELATRGKGLVGGLGLLEREGLLHVDGEPARGEERQRILPEPSDHERLLLG